ncbi:hypothetical protein F2Q69_00022626 [Brassica cretica]|uniref:Uncharacterized protein n=1 Tax=Brassica cretica TaxID=69181 RepID=A0A8S9QCL5_BRACR|nr:hypothetical protein F2Q69_00022626 [Brassica cretica]
MIHPSTSRKGVLISKVLITLNPIYPSNVINTGRCSYHRRTKGVPKSVTVLLEHFDESIHLGSPDVVMIIATVVRSS